ncbi:hypothetical protein ACSBR2_031870 [Camellia fascicularis]
MTFGEQNSLPLSFLLLDKAFNSGINFFDSAEMYPVPQRAETQGTSEEFLGRWMREREIPRDCVVLASKVSGPSGQMTWIRGGPKCLDEGNITEAIDNRYVPMFGETEYDPILQFHSIDIEEQLDALGRAVDAGKIRYVGLSKETPYGVMKFLHTAKCGPGFPKKESLQNSYDLLCRNFDYGLAECCHHEREVFRRGIQIQPIQYHCKKCYQILFLEQQSCGSCNKSWMPARSGCLQDGAYHLNPEIIADIDKFHTTYSNPCT